MSDKKVDLTKIPADQLERLKALVSNIQTTGTQYKKQKEKEAEVSAKAKQANGPNAVAPVNSASDHWFVDDKLSPTEITHVTLPEYQSWRVLFSFEEFTEALKKSTPKFISFDYDLGEGSKTGLDCAKALVDHCIAKDIKLPDWISHSSSLVKARLIDEYLFNFGKWKKQKKTTK